MIHDLADHYRADLGISIGSAKGRLAQRREIEPDTGLILPRRNSILCRAKLNIRQVTGERARFVRRVQKQVLAFG